jgi:hypothetical protein
MTDVEPLGSRTRCVSGGCDVLTLYVKGPLHLPADAFDTHSLCDMHVMDIHRTR